MRPGSVAIVGAAETDAVGVLPGHSQIRLHAEVLDGKVVDWMEHVTDEQYGK